MKIYLVRHGKIDSNNKKGYLYNSRNDDSLNKEGISQVRKLRDFISREKIDIIYSSPMKRTKETSEIIMEGLKNKPEIITDPRVMELDFGIFDGKSLDYIKKHYYKIYIERKNNKFQCKIPNGESYKMVYNRILDFLKDIYENEKNKTILIVTHATTLKLFLYLLTDYKLEDIEKIYYTNTSLFKFDVIKKENSFLSKTLLFNEKEHLEK